MPLAPPAQAFLDQLAASGAPPFSELSISEAREGLRSLFISEAPPQPIHAVHTRDVALNGASLALRSYRPDGSGAFPILLYFHGGGWVLGDLDTHDATCRALSRRAGCLVVSVDYRRAPEHKFPVPVEDCYAATCWVAENAAALGGDPRRIAVGGDSAGGNLAAAVALMSAERRKPALTYQLLIYPVMNHSFETASYRDNGDGFLLTRKSMEWFWNHYLRDPRDGEHPWASPLRAERGQDLPPAWILTAEYDPLRDEGAAYAQKLREAGVTVEHREFSGMIHGFYSLFHLFDDGHLAIAEACLKLQSAFASP